jgi:hypothetical protein
MRGGGSRGGARASSTAGLELERAAEQRGPLDVVQRINRRRRITCIVTFATTSTSLLSSIANRA